MTCKKCGKNNLLNAKYCTCCGTPLFEQNNIPSEKKRQRKNESVVVALILIMVLLLTIVAGILIYKYNNPEKLKFEDAAADGYSLMPHNSPPDFTINETVPYEQNKKVEDIEAVEKHLITERPSKSYEEKIEDAEAVEIPAPTEQPSEDDEKILIKDAFLDEADEIELYSENYLETAQTQSEINSESDVVYKKWDRLLNNVYKYLKTIMSENEFKQLQEDEVDWIIEKENAIDAAGAEWEGGSGEPMARNMTAIKYTEERCYYLISLIN